MGRALRVIAVVITTACGARSDIDLGTHRGSADAGPIDDGGVAGDFTLTVTPLSLVVTQREPPTSVNVHVERLASFAGPVDVDAIGLPFGLSATKAVLGPGQTDAMISLSATVQSEQGAVAGIAVRGTNGVTQHVVPLNVFVRGCPGCRDTTFGAKGFGAIAANFEPEAMAIDTSDRILLTAMIPSPTQVCVLLRFSPDGQVDSSFGVNGGVSLPVAKCSGSALAIDPNGRIVVVVGNGLDQTAQAHFFRFDDSGSLDASFGVSGTTSIAATNVFVDSLVIDPKGNVYAAGIRDDDPVHGMLVKLTASGQLDPAFGTSGISTLAWNTGDTAPNAIVRLVDDRLVVGGTSEPAVGPAVVTLGRYAMDATIDATFGIAGTNETNLGIANDMVKSASGRFVVGGDLLGQGTTQSLVSRYTSDGAVDSTFGKNGTFLFNPLKSWVSGVSGLAAQADEKTILLGFAIEKDPAPGSSKVYLARLDSAGAYDSDFGESGFATIALDNWNTTQPGPRLQSDGRIVVAGHSSSGGSVIKAFLIRYWP